MEQPNPEGRAAHRAESARKILAAARGEFAERGFEATTIRSIAARAGVDPSLVMQHHGSKAALFRSAVRLDAAETADVGTHLNEVVEARIAGLPPEMRALVRSMLTVPEATGAMRDHLDDRAVSLAHAMGGADTEARGALIVCAILGITLGRHFLQLGILDDISDDDLARVVNDFLRHVVRVPTSSPSAAATSS